MLRDFLRLMRPQQWTKNGLCLAGIVFGEKGRFLEPWCWGAAAATFALFCLLSSAVYVWNDVIDCERDRHHPAKCRRPVASGRVPAGAAATLAILLAAISLAGGFVLGPPTLACLAAYLLTSVLYSAWLKHVVLVDVLCIMLGYVLRLLAGVYVLGDTPTTWIILCTFFLAAFLGFSKRRAELQTLLDCESPADLQRPVLRSYTLDYLDFLISSAATMSIMAYALFTSASTKNPTLILTLPIVYYGVMHYKRQVMAGRLGEDPEWVLLTDWRIMASIALWLALFLFIWLWPIHIVR